jgi:hypothetical protein
MLPPFPKTFATEEMLICYSPNFPLPFVGEGEGEGDFTGLINERLFKVNNRTHSVRHEKALKGHFSKGTTVPIIAFFMDPSPIEDPAFIGEERIFMKTIRKKLITLTVQPFYGYTTRGNGLR